MRKFILVMASVLSVLSTACSDDENQEDQKPDNGQNQSPEEPEVPKFSDLGTPISGIIDGHAYVDFGSFKIATMNLGATKETDFGDYYAWGEVETKKRYLNENSATHEVAFDNLVSQGIVNRMGVLTPEYDAATQNWGENWKTPSATEIALMIKECRFKWMVLDSVKGFKVSSITNPDAWVFLPASGYKVDSVLNGKGKPNDQNYLQREPYGYYWSSSVAGTYDMNAHHLYCRYDGLIEDFFTINRKCGLTIRAIVNQKESLTNVPVSAKIDGHDYVDLGLPSGIKWATVNVGAKTAAEGGDFYSWGDIETKDVYNEDVCSVYGLSKEELMGKGYIDANGVLVKSYDAASNKWGGNWRMPTGDEFRELINNCDWKWCNAGVQGYKVYNKKDPSLWIFLPAVGGVGPNGAIGLSDPLGNEYSIDDKGYYWSSSIYGDSENNSYCLEMMRLAGMFPVSVLFRERYKGMSVRPVWSE